MVDDTLDPKDNVYRVVRPGMTIHVPPDAKGPTWEAFRPTDEDKGREPVRVSVWESSRTTPLQAKDMRIKAAESSASRAPASELYVFVLRVADVMTIASRFSNQRIRVVLDPDGLASILVGMSGSEGHSGIEGLDRERATPKDKWKQLLGALASNCKPAA